MKRIDYKWWLLMLMFAVSFIEQGTRQIYFVMLPQIKADFAQLGIGAAGFGSVGTVFTAVFGVSILFAGVLTDFVSRKWVIIVGTFLFSAAIFGAGFAQGMGLLILTYGIINAFGQCCVPPSSFSLLCQHHVETRARALSIYQTSTYFGIIICCFASGWLGGLGRGAWRWAFWLFGGIGMLWALFMVLSLRDTPQSASVAGSKVTLGEALTVVVKRPTSMLLALAFGMYVYAYMGFGMWIPMYLHGRFPDLDSASVAFHSVFWLYAGALAGVLTGARISDRIVSVRPAVRLEIDICGLLACAACVFAAMRCGRLPFACASLAAYGFSRGVFDSNYYPAMFDVIVPRFRAAATGITGCFAFLFGASAPMVLGWMGERLSLGAGLASLSVFYVAGAVVLLVARRFTFARDRIPLSEQTQLNASPPRK